mmetsp:Transcript_4694/g.6097  ORF Transcript_4694/g.6097 Transcript_4694/m.6097 type:complete len:329 (+) Transcript_4694:129-1115(+)
MADLVDQLEVMFIQEVSSYKTVDYLAPGFQHHLEASQKRSQAQDPNILTEPFSGESSTSSGGSSSGGITEMWREKICEWYYKVIDHFDFSREIVSMAMHYLDRYLVRRVVNKRVFQLAAMSALLLAIKLNAPSKLSMSSMIELSRGYFTVKQMEAMEKSIMLELDWLLHPPSVYGFIKHILQLLPLHRTSPSILHDIVELSRFFSEMSVIDYFFVTQRPSHIALAAIANVLQDVSASVPLETQRDFVDLVCVLKINIEDPAIVSCRQRLRLLFSSQGRCANASVEHVRPRSTPSPVCVTYGTTTYQSQVNGTNISKSEAQVPDRHEEL